MLLILTLNKQTLRVTQKLRQFPKQDWFSLVTPKTQTEGKSMLDAMMRTETVYPSHQNGDTA